MSKRWRLIPACLFLILAPAASTAKVKVESTPGFDFKTFKRYSWRVHPVFDKQPALAEQYQVGIELVKNAVNQNLINRGFQSTQQDPEFYITFLLTGKARQEVDVLHLSGGYGWGGWYGFGSIYYPAWSATVVSNYTEGLLVLDIVDAKTSQLVWRAYCLDDVKEWKNRDQNVKKLVDKALKSFPPKPKN